MKRYRRNSSKNPWKNTRNKKSIKWNKVMGVALVISVPLMIICLVGGILMRLPDVYQYNLRETQILNKSVMSVDEDELVNLISDFMWGKTDDFSLKEKVEYEPQNVFSKKDEQIMHKTRASLNILFAIGVFMFIVSFVVYFFLIRWREKDILMRNFKRSSVVFVGLSVITAIFYLVVPVREFFMQRLWGIMLKEDVFLVFIFKDSLFINIAVFNFIITWVLMGLLAYGTWSVAGRRKLFKRF